MTVKDFILEVARATRNAGDMFELHICIQDEDGFPVPIEIFYDVYLDEPMIIIKHKEPDLDISDLDISF